MTAVPYKVRSALDESRIDVLRFQEALHRQEVEALQSELQRSGEEMAVAEAQLRVAAEAREEAGQQLQAQIRQLQTQVEQLQVCGCGADVWLQTSGAGLCRADTKWGGS